MNQTYLSLNDCGIKMKETDMAIGDTFFHIAVLVMNDRLALLSKPPPINISSKRQKNLNKHGFKSMF